MPVESLVVGLSGEEIIVDVLDQVEKALRTDCNLRPTDSYGQGYSGKVTVELSLIGMDAVSVNVSSTLAPTKEAEKIVAEKQAEAKSEAEAAVAAGEPVPEPVEHVETPVEIKAEIEIPQEPDVNAVRERSGQGIPFESVDTKTGETTTKRRNYVKSTAMATGHAEEF